MKTANAKTLEIETMPGHYVRRLQQIAVALFLQETGELGLTPVQYAALQTVANAPDVDQRTLARSIGLDTTTIGGVIDRLESRGLLVRKTTPDDRRVRLLAITDAGKAVLAAAAPSVLRAQARILAPLPAKERKEFMRMLRLLVDANNDLSRAPSEV